MGQVEGKVAIVTGGASGIGAACVRAFVREGGRVVFTDLDEAKGTALGRDIASSGGEALYIRHDVTEEEGWPPVIRTAEERYGHLDVVVANAGICLLASTAEMSLEDWRRQNAVNLDGVFLSVKHALPALRRAGGGSIVIVSSVAGLRGSARFAGYCASKGGVRFFAKAVAMECAEAGDGIRVNTIHPGIIDTPLWANLQAGHARQQTMGRIDPHRLGRADAPLGRSGLVEEVAAGVLFLASEASSYVTAAELVIDGGISGGALPRRR
jgi:NAD(P)-dependent dehydrogenase (short-subunit alcohol dehydrogenase family)